MPRFDCLLDLILHVLKDLRLEQICIKSIELAKSKDKNQPFNSLILGHILRNKWLIEIEKEEQASEYNLRCLERMIEESLNLLNLMLELSLVNDTTESSKNSMREAIVSKDWSSKRLLYIKQLSCVQ